MKPTLRALLTLFERHRGEFLNHAVVYEAGGHRTTARIMELRQMGHVIQQEGAAESSRYRLVSSPVVPSYASLSCSCGWSGPEPQVIHTLFGNKCPRCGADV